MMPTHNNRSHKTVYVAGVSYIIYIWRTYVLKTNKKETLNQNHYHDICRYIENKMNADEYGILTYTHSQTYTA